MLKDFELAKLKTMNTKELEELAEECRKEIIETVSTNGGHIGSNLGAVELTIALHKVFDSPKDKFIFDVSHQTYTHKLLTNRFDDFKTLRKLDGISGFSKMNESVHDAYDGGHSSSSIAYGIGMMEARKTNPNQIGEIISIIGDGSLTNGLALSSINQLATIPDKMIIIINDNGMSISKNVGAIAKRYNKLRTFKPLGFLHKITSRRVKKFFQYLFYKQDTFTSLGFKYFEDINGHDFNELIKYLEYAKASPKSVILHVKTVKGKGYEIAEKDNEGFWHGVGPFDIETGSPISPSGKTFGLAANDAIINLAKEDENKTLRVICPAMGIGCGISEFIKQYPDKYVDCGIAEENAMVIAASMAQNGLKPIVFGYSTFMQRAYDEILIDIARTNSNVITLLDRSEIVPDDGGTHQGVYDLAYLSSIPNVKIYAPATLADLKLMIKTVYNNVSGPVFIKYPKGSFPNEELLVDESLNWKVIIPNKKKYIITYGPHVIDVKNYLINNKINCGLIYASDLTQIKPEYLDLLGKVKEIITYENEEYTGSLLNKLVSYITLNHLDLKIDGIYLKDGYLTEGKVNELKKLYHVSIDDLDRLL